MVDGERPFLYAQRADTGGGRKGSGGGARWSDVYATLVTAGYGQPGDISRMTQRQILLHYEAELRRQRRERAARMKDINLAFAGGKDAEQHLKALLKP